MEVIHVLNRSIFANFALENVPIIALLLVFLYGDYAWIRIRVIAVLKI